MSPRALTAVRRLLAPALVAVFLCAPASAPAAERTGRLLVMVDEPARSAAATTALQGLGVRTSGAQVPEVGLVTVRPQAGETLAATAAEVRKLPWVRSVTVERRHALRFTPNDPAVSQAETAPGTPAGISRQWWAARESLFEAWDLTRGSGAKVAIIDTGIDAGHPEVAGKISHALDNDATFGAGPATSDANGHGTHVASLACAGTNNATGIVGAGWKCNLIVMKSDFTDSSIAKSLVQATDLGADAINMSFGTDGSTPPPPSLVEALNYAINRDVVLVAAAANQPGEEQGDPANVLQPTGTGPDIDFNKGLSVTSVDFDDRRSDFAGQGSQISLAAYGDYSSSTLAGPAGILAAWPANRTEIEDLRACGCRTTINGDNRYAYLHGTSIAAPQVAGVAATVAHLNPDLSGAEVVRLLKQTATRPHGSSWGRQLGWGIVNLRAAVDAARVIDRRAPTSKVLRPRRRKGATRFTLKWSGKDVPRPGLVASGIRRYDVYRSKDGGRYRRFASTRRTRRKIEIRRGARYRFYTIAVDRRGNRERKPRRADVSLKVRRRR